MNSGIADESANQVPIDAVITWVDGSDLKHVERREAELAKQSNFRVNAIPGGRSYTRFADNDEIRYCILSIRKYCPWIRTIFLVTDRQAPVFLNQKIAQNLGVCVVDHKQIFQGYESALPTFNSQSIETALHRIDGLSERFIYFNDDVIVLRQTAVEEFFTSDGRVVLRGEWKPLPKFGKARILLSSIANHIADKVLGKVRSMAVLAQYRAAKIAGFQRQFLQAPHVPHPLRKSTLAEYFERNPDMFVKNISYKFRDMEQFVPIPLANHLEIKAKAYVQSQSLDYILICFNRDARSAIERKIAALEKGDQRFLCLQGLERARPSAFEKIESLLDKCVGLDA